MNELDQELLSLAYYLLSAQPQAETHVALEVIDRKPRVTDSPNLSFRAEMSRRGAL